MKKFTFATLGVVLAGACAASQLSFATVTYTFTPSTVEVGYDNSAGGQVGFTGADARTQIASLQSSITFSSALAANATTTFSYESGGYEFVGGPNSGGVIAYESDGFSSLPISSDISNYVSGSSGLGDASIFRYSSMNGSITTNAVGNIVAWSIDFLVHDVAPGSLVWVGPGPQPPGFPAVSISSLDLAVFLHSTSTALNLAGLAAVNGDPTVNTLNATVFDEAFGDPGPVQLHRYTTQVGTWTSSVSPVPIAPSTTLLTLGGLLLWQRRRAAIAMRAI